MVRILRIVLTLIGVGLVLASSALTWVNVDIDTDAFAELAEESADGAVGEALDSAVESAVDGAVDGDVDVSAEELFDEATDAIEAARGIIPDRLLDATLNGQNSYDLFGLGFVLAGLALTAAIAAVVWSISGTGWLRWIGLLCAVALLFITVAVPASIFATDAALENFLPEDWKQFSPSFDVTTAPLGAIGGSFVIVLSLLGRSPKKRVAAGVVTPAPYVPHTAHVQQTPHVPAPQQPPVPPAPQGWSPPPPPSPS